MNLTRCLILLLVLAAACGGRPTPVVPAATPAAELPLATQTPAGAPTSSRLADAIASAAAATDAPEVTPEPLGIERITRLPQDCQSPPTGLPAEGLREVAYLATGFCSHGEIGLFETGGRLYAVQALNDEVGYVAFVISDVTAPARPTLLGAWQWSVPTATADVKPFRQGERWFLVIARQGMVQGASERLCSRAAGVALIEVTDPAAPVLLDVLTGERVGSREAWCNVHTTEVSADAAGNASFLYLSSTDTYDLRIVDLRDLSSPREINHYTHPDAGFYNSRNEFFVHDTTIVDDRVYVAYWSAGAIILDRERLEAGRRTGPLNPLDSLDPWGLQTHHVFPVHGGDYVYLEDEFHSRDYPRLRLYDIRDLSNPREVAAIALPDELSAPHNLLVEGDRLFVGWYQDGVRVFDLDASDPDHPVVVPAGFLAVRASRTSSAVNGGYDGIWGVRLRDCVVDGQRLTCVYASDMTYGLRILAVEP